MVGDPHQQIYAFRGAVNAMDMIQCTRTFYLTQVFICHLLLLLTVILTFCSHVYNTCIVLVGFSIQLNQFAVIICITVCVRSY